MSAWPFKWTSSVTRSQSSGGTPQNAKNNNLELFCRGWYCRGNMRLSLRAPQRTVLPHECLFLLSCRLAKSWQSFKSILRFIKKTYCDITDNHRTNLWLSNQFPAHRQSVTGLTLAYLLCHSLLCWNTPLIQYLSSALSLKYVHCCSTVIQFLIPIQTRLVKLSNNNKDWIPAPILLHQTTIGTFMISETLASPHKYLHPPQLTINSFHSTCSTGGSLSALGFHDYTQSLVSHPRSNVWADINWKATTGCWAGVDSGFLAL